MSINVVNPYEHANIPEQELITPPLTDGLILPGVTRDSVLTLAREWNEFQISERYLTMEELKQAIKEGRVSLNSIHHKFN